MAYKETGGYDDDPDEVSIKNQNLNYVEVSNQY